jgi:hypothetical protein
LAAIASRVPHGGLVDAGHAAIHHDRAALGEDAADRVCASSRHQGCRRFNTWNQIAVVVDEIEIEHQKISRMPRGQLPTWADLIAGGAQHRAPSVGAGKAPEIRIAPIGLEAPTAMQRAGQPHLAKTIVVLVEGQTVKAHRNPATGLSHCGERCNAGAQVQVRTGIHGNRGPSLGEQRELFGPGPGAVRECQAR